MTRLDDIEAAYARASGTWLDADWAHERRDVDGIVYDGIEPVYCDGCAPCGTCAAAKASAKAAESAGAAALEAAREGDWAAAVAAAAEAARVEQEWGDDPTWGPFAAAFDATDDDDDEDDLDDDAICAGIVDAYTTADDELLDALSRARRGEASAALVRALRDLAATIRAEVDGAGELRRGALSSAALDAAEAAVIAADADDDDDEVAL